MAALGGGEEHRVPESTARWQHRDSDKESKRERERSASSGMRNSTTFYFIYSYIIQKRIKEIISLCGKVPSADPNPWKVINVAAMMRPFFFF